MVYFLSYDVDKIYIYIYQNEYRSSIDLIKTYLVDTVAIQSKCFNAFHLQNKPHFNVSPTS